MGDVLRAALREADEVDICVAFLRFSGLGLVVKELEAFTARGGQLRVIVSTYLNVTQPGAVRVLASLSGAQIKLQTGPKGLHTKYYMFGRGRDRRTCWVGSSNFTKSGLFSSIEWNTCHDDPEAVADAEALFTELWERADVILASDEAIWAYERTFLAAQMAAAPPTSIGTGFTAPLPNTAQGEALAQLARLRRDGARRAAVIAATGVGKTLLAAFDAGALACELGRAPDQLSVLFIAHREELLQQACAAYRQLHPAATTGLLVSGQRPGHARVVFATVQSLLGHPELLSRHYDQVVIDEVHHAAAASYRTVLGRLNFHFLLGLTATPERADGHDVLALCDYNVAYEVRLPEAIDHGWLIPFHYFGIADNVDYTPVPWRSGRFDPEALENALLLESRTDLILRHALEKGYDGRRRATVGFCAGVRHARYMAETLGNRGFRAEAITGTVPPAERQRLYDDFADPGHPLEWLFVADVLNEGIDLPAINSLLFLRPTQSPGLFLQQLGRGLRHHPGTEVLTVLDFVGHHKNALVPLQALSRDALRLVGHRHLDSPLQFSPPTDCAVVLEDQTQAILLKVQRELPAAGGKKAHAAAYRLLREELGRPPHLMDFWGRSGVPGFQELRRTFGSWVECRAAMGDADDWERRVERDPLAGALLRAAETNLQLQRVGAYAVAWAMVFFPDDPASGVNAFFVRFPQWRVEQDVEPARALKTLEKKPAWGVLLRDGTLDPALRARLRTDPRLAEEVERRLEYLLAGDHAERHGGVLRTPGALTRYHGYRRSEIVNHLGVQYDPARHNTGAVQVGSDIALLTQLDTRDARAAHQYRNGFLEDRRFFSWESQNRMVPDRGSGQAVADHRRLGHTLHLFAQPGGAGLYFYLGPVDVDQVRGSAPFTAVLKLPERLPATVEEQLLGGG
ncbi:restriction endonuclease [Deinococcus aerophilus]|uniref:Restriction endonuclease n=2 Tax=Deinococcus aerophilus TaxID=522488 RepID=A0ABQ2GYG8_9DEIO|nr:restriction endonuclease [Deinococcus aerophilus]